MTTLIKASDTPKGIGLFHDNERLYPYSGCCGVVVTRMPGSLTDFHCERCDHIYPGNFINDEDTDVVDYLGLVNFNIYNPESITKWCKAWTGVDGIEIEVSWE